MDEIERAAIRDEGYDPDNPDVVAALDPLRAELAAIGNWSSFIASARAARPACEAAVNAEPTLIEGKPRNARLVWRRP